MRALFAIVLSAVGIVAGSAAAAAADFKVSTHYDVTDPRAEPQLIYQYEPGVAMRAYWRSPWRNHHYFPRTGKRPATGRYERLSARRYPTRLAASYERYWSNAAAVPCNCAWLGARNEQVLPDRRISRIPSAPRAPKP
jgi:hypothetical protein